MFYLFFNLDFLEITWKVDQDDCKNERDTFNFEIEHDLERERLKKAMEKRPGKHLEENEISYKKALDKFYMLNTEKTRRKRSKEFRECVHVPKKFEEVH
jgi:hypothetical protein